MGITSRNSLFLRRFWIVVTLLSINVAADSPKQNPIGHDYRNLLILAAVLCMVAIIILAVPALADYLRRWHENRRMLDEMKSSEISKISRAKEIIQAEQMQHSPLGWEENGQNQPSTLQTQLLKDKGKTILVADDDPVVVTALSRHLQRLGYQVLRSPDATHALLGAVKMHPDLLILDINMPAGNGLAVCEMIVSDPKNADLPIIIHSVIADDATKERCRQLGAYYIEKSPRSWEQIKLLIDRLFSSEKTSSEPREEPAEESTQAPVEEAAAITQAETIAGSESQEKPSEKEQAFVPETPAKESQPPETKEKAKAASATSEFPIPMLPVCGRPRLMCVEMPSDRLALVDHQLSALGLEVFRTSDLEEAFWMCFTEKPHAILIQIAEKSKQLLDFLGRLKQHPVTRGIPLIVINEDNLELAPDPAGDNLVKILKYPMDWQDLLAELETLFPLFQQHPDDPLAKKQGLAKVPKHEPETVTATPEEVHGRRLTILSVDDDPIVARSISARLRPYGINVLSAVNGTQGFLMAVAKTPDLILLDLKMPEGEGSYILNKLKDNPHTKDIPVIILTVTTHAGVKRQLLSAGAEAFLNKPIRWAELFEAMARCVTLPKQLLIDYKLPVEELNLLPT